LIALLGIKLTSAKESQKTKEDSKRIQSIICLQV
jgi:hypothetical protein